MKTRVAIALAGIAAIVVAVFLFECSGFSASLPSCGACRFVYDYQSLLAGVLALAAALIALVPVFDQLKMSRLQSAIMTRDVLLRRLASTEAKREKSAKIIRSITDDFDAVIFPGDSDTAEKVDAEWAFHCEELVRIAIGELEKYQQSLSDPAKINEVRSQFIATAESLRACLYLIPLPERAPWDDTDLGLSQTQMKEAAAKADKDAKIAEKELPDKISAAHRAGKVLDDAYRSILATLRLRLRKIDDFILERDV